MKDKKEINKPACRRITILILFMFTILGYLGYNIYSYWNKINNNYQEKEKLSKELTNLLSDEETLNSEIVKLSDPEYVARFAREKFLYSKNGEIIFRIIK